MSASEHKEVEPTSCAADIAELLQTFYDTANDTNSPLTRVQEQLLALRSSLLSSPSALSTFLSHHYGPFTLYLLGRFSVEWLSRLESASREPCFYFFFSSAFPASRVFLSIAASLRSRPATSTSSSAMLGASVVLNVLDSFLQRQGMAELLEELNSVANAPQTSGDSSSNRPIAVSLPPSSTACLDSVASLPDFVANRLQSSTPPSLRAEAFFTATLQQLPPSPLPTVPLAYLVSKLSRLGHARLFFASLLPPVFAQMHVEERKDDSDEWQQLPSESASAAALSAVLLTVNSAALEGALDALLWQLAQYVDRGTYSQQQAGRVMYALLSPAMLSPSATLPSLVKEAPYGGLMHFLLTNKFLISRPVSRTASALILSFLFRLSYPPLSSVNPCQPVTPLFDETLTTVARLWSSASFLHHTTPALQHSVTSALLHAFSLLHHYQHTHLLDTTSQYRAHVASAAKTASDDTQLMGPFSSHPALLAVMEGVQLRMSEMDDKRRKEGMRVAVEMSRLMDPTHVLNFDVEDEDDREEKEEEERKLKAEEERKQRHEQHRQQALTATSSATTLSTRPLPVYDLSEDTSDLRKVPLPRYLRDAVELLRKQDERENVEAALEQLDTLIRSRPFDLPDVAPDLVAMLQQVATTVHCENKTLDAKRRAALVSVAVECPDVAAPLLIRSFHGQSLTLMGKVEVLEVLVAAAEELSGKKTSKQNKAPPAKNTAQTTIDTFKSSLIPSAATPPPSTAIPPSAASSDPSRALTRAQHNDVIAQRVASRTRRWGTARQPAETFINRFAAVAHLFFFPLVNSLHVSGGWGSAQPVVQTEPLLLSHVLNTLSVIVILASPSAHSLDAMTAQLLAVLLTTRFHTNVTVRHMTLLSLLRVLLVLPTSLLIPTHGAMLRELRVWVSDAMSGEADDECRQLAVLCAGEMGRAMQGLGEWELAEERRAGAVSGLELIVPGSASLTSPSSVRGSSMIKFL